MQVLGKYHWYLGSSVQFNALIVLRMVFQSHHGNDPIRNKLIWAKAQRWDYKMGLRRCPSVCGCVCSSTPSNMNISENSGQTQSNFI